MYNNDTSQLYIIIDIVAGLTAVQFAHLDVSILYSKGVLCLQNIAYFSSRINRFSPALRLAIFQLSGKVTLQALVMRDHTGFTR